ncbi:MAG: bifunctional diaminohydroxyphosphoribosylaminopyrimidine deaminase/5-amino-6-(5-phosphoribosylamino)uracil reductase RibD [Phycisphaerales bacterium]|nr:bifunctional diaminohydroxyphosphoribosylaminopyrimidine deaminase/5-amino-6-(5-phosphoribosylamino)uracil reductase RibD [Phycisphaerales bacterium]
MTQQIFTSDQIGFMHKALQLARRGLGRVEPNPLVGCVIVRNGTIIATGYHRAFGGPHAEIEALKAAGTRARGAELYVTLEPCCHTGKTGPCTRAIIAAGVRRVVAAMIDPFPAVAGRGFAELRKAGLDVTHGLLTDQAAALNAPFIKRIHRHLPYCIMKWAQSLDGCVATRSGHSQWISCPESRQRVHELRGRVDAIMTGINTVLTDDPLLTCRAQKASALKRIAMRVVLDSTCRTPLNSKLVHTAKDYPLLIAHKANLPDNAGRRAAALRLAGAELMPLGSDPLGRLRLDQLLKNLSKRGITNVLVEAGPTVMGSLLMHRDLVDSIEAYIAPRVLGDTQAPHAIAGFAPRLFSQAMSFTWSQAQLVGVDWLLTAQLKKQASSTAGKMPRHS